ncbi:unnamed protein product [Paramecium primaurelia]|uniref:Uncharacterized protein n=1 Tax=Paramecium primaurelia TaxID=5886 RepID=A0A8S1MYT7_PARPR|nr:unnamed protein product [Paramecium primaurelia]
MLQEYGLTQEQLTKQIIIGLAHPQHIQFFQQIITINEYKIFGKQMQQVFLFQYQLYTLILYFQLINIIQNRKIQQFIKQQQQNINNQQLAPQFDQQFELNFFKIEKEKAEIELAIQKKQKMNRNILRKHKMRIYVQKNNRIKFK